MHLEVHVYVCMCINIYIYIYWYLIYFDLYIDKLTIQIGVSEEIKCINITSPMFATVLKCQKNLDASFFQHGLKTINSPGNF